MNMTTKRLVMIDAATNSGEAVMTASPELRPLHQIIEDQRTHRR